MPTPMQTPAERLVRRVTVGIVIAMVVGALVVAGIWAWRSDVGGRPTAPTSSSTPGATHTPTLTQPPRSSGTPTPARPQPGDNALHGMVVPDDAACAAPLPPTPLDLSSEAAIQPLLDCLLTTWSPEYRRVMRAELPVPRLELIGRATGTPCGTTRDNSYYCARNQTIYLRTDAFGAGGPLSSSRLSLLCLLARELGHHVQNLSGVWKAFESELAAVSDAHRPELRRRLELQADCFAGMALRGYQGSFAIDGADLNRLHATRGSLGDDAHGSAESQVLWQQTGWEGQSMVACNTWLADATLVG